MSRTIAENIMCKFQNLKVTGTALIETWDGNLGTIQMTPFELNEFTYIQACTASNKKMKDAIRARLNDAGFGCKEIIAAHCDIFAQYDYGPTRLIEELIIENRPMTKKEKDELELGYTMCLPGEEIKNEI